MSDLPLLLSNLISANIERVKSNMTYDGFANDVNDIEKVIYHMLYEDIQEDITEKYESVYQCLCSNYSLAYLSGSSFYVGDVLEDWWVKETTDCQEKLFKWVSIKETLDEFLK